MSGKKCEVCQKVEFLDWQEAHKHLVKCENCQRYFCEECRNDRFPSLCRGCQGTSAGSTMLVARRGYIGSRVEFVDPGGAWGISADWWRVAPNKRSP